MAFLTTAYRSGDPKFGSKSLSKDLGGAMFAGKEVDWKKHEYYRQKGINYNKPDGKRADKAEIEADVFRASGMTFAPHYTKTDGTAEALTEGDTTTLVLEGKPYEVRAEGIRVVNEDLYGYIVEKSLEREQFVNDIVELCLIVGDNGVKALHPALYIRTLRFTCR